MSGLALDPAKTLQPKSKEALLRELFPNGIEPQDYGVLPLALQLIDEYQGRVGRPESRIYLVGGADDFCALVRDILVRMGRGRALKVTVQEEVV
jgi:hypothetical protein